MYKHWDEPGAKVVMKNHTDNTSIDKRGRAGEAIGNDYGTFLCSQHKLIANCVLVSYVHTLWVLYHDLMVHISPPNV